MTEAAFEWEPAGARRPERRLDVLVHRETMDVRGARDPAPVVLVGIPVRYGNAGFADQWGDDASFINDELPEMLEELEGDVDGFVPFDLALTDESHYDDPIHPNSAGFARMAAIAADVVLRWRTRAPVRLQSAAHLQHAHLQPGLQVHDRGRHRRSAVHRPAHNHRLVVGKGVRIGLRHDGAERAARVFRF